MKKGLLTLIPAVFIVALWIFLFTHKELSTYATEYVESAGSLSYLVYLCMVIGASSILPLSAMPLIPIAAGIMGPLVTVILSIIGWIIGATIAFLLARHYGRRVLKNYISLDGLDELTERFPIKNRFMFVMVFRLVLPTDLASYALGLTKSLGFVEYFCATLVSVVWYSLALAYLGSAVMSGNILLALKLVCALLVIFAIGWYLLRHSKSPEVSQDSQKPD